MTQRNTTPHHVCLAAIAAVLAVPAAAQETETSVAQAATPANAPDEEDDSSTYSDEIVVIASSLFGEVDAGVPPVDVLDEQDIAAYGAGSIAELLDALSPQTGSSRGRGSGPPVFLVNGLRVSSFREMRSYPPEALQKVEILPEEVAQRYGFPPDQRVVNFILKPNFSSRQLAGEFEQPDIGGYHQKEFEGTYLKLGKNSRMNFNAKVQDTTPLTEAERNVQQADGSTSDVAGDPDPAEYRTLIADSRELQFTGNYTTSLGTGTSLSVNGSVDRTDSLSLSGLDSVTLTAPDGSAAFRTLNADDPLKVDTGTTTFSAGSTLNASLGGWQMTGTIDASHARTVQEIDRRADTSALVAAAADGTLAIDGALPGLADAGFDTAETITKSANTKWTMMGRPVVLPGGELGVTFDAGFDWLQLDSSDTRTDYDTSLTRGDANAGVNLFIPITSRREGFGDALGDITINLSGGVDHLSDFGTLTDWSSGFNWGVTEKLSLQASFIAKDAAPGLGQLGNPEVITLNVPYYDLSRNETVLVTTTSGGNPDLSQEKQRDIHLAAFWDTPVKDLRLSIEYNKNRSNDVTASFPQLTPEVEAAFSDRITRDASGQLIAIDMRPVTYAEQKSSRLTFGLNMSGSFGKAKVQSESQSGGFAAGGAAGGAQGGMAPPQGQGQGGPRGNFDPERFKQMRERFCGTGSAGSPLPEIQLSEEEIARLPERMAARFKDENGNFDQARFKEFQQRFCSMDGPPNMARGGGEGAGTPPGGAGGPPPAGGGAGGPPPGGGGRGPRFGPPGGDGKGRWFAHLNYTRELTNEVLIAPGMDVLDQLNGESISSSGTPRDTAELEGGAFYRGFGLRASAKYTGAADVDDLHFGSLAKLDLRLFANLEEVIGKDGGNAWAKGVRVSLKADNVFDTRRKVTDANGETPIRYQPMLIDPTGRYIGIDIRKIF